MAGRPAGGQRITGTVVRESVGQSVAANAAENGAIPVSGAVVLLLSDTRDSVIARGMTAPNGRFLLQAPGAGTYRVRVLRIGQRPLVQGPWRVGASETLDVVIAATEQPVQLARFDVRAEARCRTDPDGSTLVGQLLAEARTAFLASVSAMPDGEPLASYRLYARPEDLHGEPVAAELASSVTRATARPFASLPPDSILKVGYIAIDGDSVVYRGPDAEVLLSSSFAETHCFQVVEGIGGNAGALGIAFRPTTRRRGVVDIRGTIWMRPDSTVPRVVEFQYEPVSAAEEKAAVGGMVEFATTGTGTWFVRSFALRMPRMVLHRINAVMGRRPVAPRVTQELAGIIVSGGDVLEVRVGERSVFADSAAIRHAAAEQALAAAQEAAALERALEAQRARLTVRVRNEVDSIVRNAEVVVTARGQERVMRTDSLGTARFESLSADTVELSIRQVGLEAQTHRVAIAPGENDVTVLMRAIGTVLAPVRTVGNRVVNMRYEEVDTRIRHGVPNDAVTRKDLDKVRPIVLSQMLRRLRGIRIADSLGGTVAISLRGGQPNLADPTRPCVLRVMVDDIIMPPQTSLDAISPTEVYAVELFLGPARLPVQFAGMRTDLWCGLVAIWTRVQ